MSDYIVSQADRIETVTSTVQNASIIVSTDFNTSSLLYSNSQGPEGLPGMDGMAGMQGAPGPIGPRGIQGVQGIQGTSAETTMYTHVTDNTFNEQVIDSFPYTSYGAAKYLIYSTSGIRRQINELLLIHDSATATLVEYANIYTLNSLVTFNVSITESSIRLTIVPTQLTMNVRLTRTLFPA